MKERHQKTERKGQAFFDELELGLHSPLQLWGDHTAYTEECGGILDLGTEYIRFLSGKMAVTIFGTGIRVEEYRSGRLMVRGKFTSIELG